MGISREPLGEHQGLPKIFLTGICLPSILKSPPWSTPPRDTPYSPPFHCFTVPAIKSPSQGLTCPTAVHSVCLENCHRSSRQWGLRSGNPCLLVDLPLSASVVLSAKQEIIVHSSPAQSGPGMKSVEQMQGKRSNRWDHQHSLILSGQSKTLPSQNQPRQFWFRRRSLLNRAKAKTTQHGCLIVLLSLHLNSDILSLDLCCCMQIVLLIKQ